MAGAHEISAEERVPLASSLTHTAEGEAGEGGGATLASPVEQACLRYEEARRWRRELRAQLDRALHEFGVAAAQEERALAAYLAALPSAALVAGETR